MFRVSFATAAMLLCGSVEPSVAQIVLTFEEVVARARDQAGPVVVARTRIAEAEASILDASARLRDNPVLEAAAGPRRGGGVGGTDLDIGVSQQFETGGQRQARIATALAAVDRQRAAVAEVSRVAIFEAASAFVRGVAAGERLRIAEEASTVSRDLLSAMERRYGAGDIAAIDLNLTRIDAARSIATLGAGRADLAEAVGTLRTIVRIPQTDVVELRGSLDLPPVLPLQDLETAVLQRPEFRVLDAEAREADAQIRLGRALRRPDLGFRVNYEREALDTVVLGGFTVTIPSFQRGQGTLAAGLARATRLRVEVETARQFALDETRTAYQVHTQRARLAEELTRDALASVVDNESLARRSFDEGELNLMDFLLIRRDALDTRLSVVDRRLEAALSRLQVDFAAGVLR